VHRPDRRPALLRLVAALFALAMLAAACGGGGDDDDGGAQTQGTDGTNAGKPQEGGKLVFGLEAETDGFDPTKNRFDISGHMRASSIYDTLLTIEDGKPAANLAASVEPNAEYTVWTIKLRPGVKFHDGTPLNADAVKLSLDGHLNSLLTGFALTPVKRPDGIAKVDDLTVTVSLNQPWVPFPYYLTGQFGYVPAPKTLLDPNGGRAPIGTGPFVFKEWVPGQRFVATKNPNYWRKDADGVQLPYLDEIEFRTMVDDQARAAALRSGDVDAIHTTRDEDIKTLRDDNDLQLFEDDRGEEGFIMLNTAIEPFNNAHARRALALATDRNRYVQTLGSGIIEIADQPFGDDELGHLTDAGYPEYNLEAAKKEVAAYKKDTGKDLSFDYGGTPDPDGRANQQFIQQMWRQAGIDSNIVTVEQSSYIGNALNGDYQAYGWRQFGGADPDTEFVWWTSANAQAIGTLSLNFARNKDQAIDAALEVGRRSSDKAQRDEAYQTVVRRLNRDLPYIWLNHTLWAVGAQKNVHGLEILNEQGGIGSLGGKNFVSEAWLDQ
jgi:peptide/nickel transport system substrate-binding protein